MSNRCKDYVVDLIDLASGEDRKEARAHVEQCTRCQKKLEQFKVMSAVAKTERESAPEWAVRRAKEILPLPEKVKATWNPSRRLAHARDHGDDFQVVIRANDHKVRLLFGQTAGGWEVLGRTPNANWLINRHGETLPTDEFGQFSFIARTLDATDFSLIGDGCEIEVPSADEILHID